MHQIVCAFAAPIPLGHRVECRWFSQQIEKLFGGSEAHTFQFEPLVIDLQTGIEYGTQRPWRHGSAKAMHQPLPIGPEPNPEVQVTHRLVGTVRRCRVISLPMYERGAIQTHLDIQPEQ